MLAYIVLLLILLSIFASLFKLFPEAGRQSWEALIPGYNFYVWLKVIEKPWWWLFLLIFPGPNLIMLMIMCVNTATVFNRRETSDVLQAAFLPFIYLPKMAFTDQVTYVGAINRTKFPKTSTQEWRDAILFAIVAASIIRTYTFEAFTIPTSSMEKTMLIGDYLFVNKLSYGPRIPNTPLSFPFAHHSLPLTNNSVPSYLKWFEFDYTRLPGFGDVERNDVVVFNYPTGDTVDVVLQSNKGYDQLIRDWAIELKSIDYKRGGNLQSDEYYQEKARQHIHEKRDLTVRPVDKRENFIKRCVGIPGDVIEIKDGTLFVNGEQAEQPKDMQFSYIVQMAGDFPKNQSNLMKLKTVYNINFQDVIELVPLRTFMFPLTAEAYERMQRDPMVKRIERLSHKKDKMSVFTARQVSGMFDAKYKAILEEQGMYNPDLNIFPNHPNYHWTEDFFGPLEIPKAGNTVQLTLENLPIYERIIGVYEANDLRVADGKIYINGEATNSYTFNMNYYWLMGDNRHNSADSRFWGFVPEDHVVGKAAFVWMSIDPELDLSNGKIRWDRFFTVVR